MSDYTRCLEYSIRQLLKYYFKTADKDGELDYSTLDTLMENLKINFNRKKD